MWGARIPESRSRFILGINDRDDARVAAGQRIERRGRDRRDPGVEGAELSGQHALAEAPVARRAASSGRRR